MATTSMASTNGRRANRSKSAAQSPRGAAAWSAKSFSLYAGFYAPSFEPADGSSRASWAKQREQRLATPKRVQVEVRNLKLKEASSDMLLAEFEQHYSSDSYSDVTLKTLTWVKVGGQWLIQRETARPAGAAAAVRQKDGK